METRAERFRSAYGAGAVHLLAVLVALAVAGSVVLVLGLTELFAGDSWWQTIAVWFIGAALLHDLVLLPLYALADHGLKRVIVSRRVLNHIRVPAMASGLLFLLFFPGILQQGADDYASATGQTQDPFLERWLLVSATFFVLSGLLFAVRVARRRNSP